MSKLVEIPDAINALYIYTESFYGGFENISEEFFKDYEEHLKKGRHRGAKKTIRKTDEQEILQSNKNRTKTETGFDHNTEENKSKRVRFFQKSYIFGLLSKIQSNELDAKDVQANLQSIYGYVMNKEAPHQYNYVRFDSMEELGAIFDELVKEMKVFLENGHYYLA